MKYQKLMIFILMTLCFLSAADYNAVPQTNNTFPFQGYFTDSQGRAYFGTVIMGFKFFSDKNATNVVYGGSTGESMVRSVKVYNGFYATKISFPEDAFAKFASYDNIWVNVYVAKSVDLSDIVWGITSASAEKKRLDDDSYLLKPPVQLTAAPYALGVRGLAYESGSDTTGKGVLKIGGAYRSTSSVARENGKDNLIISGNVRVSALNSTENAKLVIRDILMGVDSSTISINGTLSAPDGVYGAVWN
jgi:hypothetical protein